MLGLPERSKLSVDFTIVPIRGWLRSPFLAFRFARQAKRLGVTHVFCREERLLFFFLIWTAVMRIHVECFFGVHWIKKDFFFKWAVRHTAGCIAITQAIADELVELGIERDHILVAPDGVDLSRYENLPSKHEARERFRLPYDRKVIGYTGSIGVHSWKGVDVLLAASDKAPSDWLFWIIGGNTEEVESLRKLYPMIRFEGRADPTLIPAMQSACDVLVLPNKSGNPISERYTSPLKLFEYMASGVPIVASDLPSVREVLSDDEAVFCEPGNPGSLVLGILQALDGMDGSRARLARRKVSSYTWDARARAIIDFMAHA